MTLHIHLLGQFQARADEHPIAGFEQKRLQALLAYLLLSGPDPVPREQAAFAFWPDSTDAQAHTNLRNLLHRLRDVLPDSENYLQFNRHRIWWRQSDAYRLDVADFNTALVAATAAEKTEDLPATCRALEQAVAIYEGDLLPTCYDDWIMGERERLRQAFLHSLDRLVLLLERQRAYGPAIQYAQLLVRRDPLHEAAYRHLMRLHLASGDRASALRVYHACATHLRRELGVDPGTATQAVYETVLHADEAPPARAVTSQPPQAPAVTALVGREREWAQLQNAWRNAITGHPQMILLVGETGIGKTRLAEELSAWVARQQQTAAAAHCYPTEQTLAYAPVAALLRDPALAQRLAKLDAAWLTEISRLLPELAVTHPDLAAPGPMTEPWQRQRLFQALTQAILTSAVSASSEHAPLLLVIDDLQWCDPDTLDWLLYLLDTAGAAPLLVIGTACCSELNDKAPVEILRLNLERRALVTRIELGALPPAAAAELALGLAGRVLNPEEASALQREAEGNPLFIVEMVRAGLEFVAREGRTPAAKAEGESIVRDDLHPLPPRVEAAVRRRMAGLSASARELAQTAAVVGRIFTLDTLARISAHPEDTLLRALDELWRHRIVREQGATAYDFAHDKLRVVAYAELSPARRRQLHRRVAEALESSAPAPITGGEIAAQLAHHHLEAGDERKALDYLLQAGDQARIMYAHQEAVSHYERAIALQRRLGQPDAAARTLMKLGLTYHNAFDFARARETYDAGFALWRHATAAQPRLAPAAPQTLRSHWGSLTTLDPGLVGDFNTVAIVEELFTGLADHGPEAEVTPALAANWDVEDGGRRYVFHLRRGLQWSDGTPLVAADFEAGWRRVLHPATRASCASFLYDVRGARAHHNGEAADPAAIGVLAVDDLTLIVELERPAGYFPHLLANPITYPVPRHALAAYGQAWANPEHLVSNGPFILAEWQRGERMILARNPRYYAPFSGNTQRVELALENDAETIMAAYAADALDVVHLDYRFSLAERDALRERHAGDLVAVSCFGAWFLGFDPAQPPLDDPRVRQALAMAVDRELMAGAVLRGFATPATGGLVPPGMPGHVAGIGLPYDPAAGRRLLADAGYPDGRGFPTLTLVCEQTVLDQVRFLQAQWQDHLGITVALASTDWPTFLRRMESEHLAIYYSAWHADYPDPDDFLRVALQWRRTRWHDTVYAELVERARAITDPQVRLAIYAQAERRLIEQAAIVPLNYRRSFFLIKPRIVRYPASGLRPWFWQDVLIDPS